MKISVIMPAFNAEKYVKEAILSIVGQTYTNWELLVCDDCSTDDTYEVISNLAKSDKRIHVFRNEKNLKKPLTVDKLVKKSSGDLLTFHDADDTSHLSRFEKIITLFGQKPEVAMIGHEIERITETGIPLQIYRKKESDFQSIKKSMSQWNSDGDASIFIKKEVIDKLKWIYRPFFTNSMDYDFGLRVIEHFKTTNLLETLFYYRNVPGSISKGVDGYEKFLMPDFAKEFAKQREKKGIDSLMEEDQDEIDKIRLRLAQPYLKDKALHLRKMVDFFSYVKMNQNAYHFAKRAVKKAPFKLINWKYFLTSIKNSKVG